MVDFSNVEKHTEIYVGINNKKLEIIKTEAPFSLDIDDELAA